VNTDGLFILTDAGITSGNTAVFGPGAENLKTTVAWNIDLITQYKAVVSGGGKPL
jgi:hypothetical protein